MKTTQYVRLEHAISAADSGGIRQRWLWGLRLLNDVEAMSSPKSLKHGAAEQLVAAARAGGEKLSVREIQLRLQCARAYPTDSQICRSTADFDTWTALVAAGFPAYEAPAGEAPADYRTQAERDHDRARALTALLGEQGALFPLRDFEPVTTTLKDLASYIEEQEALTERFAKHGRKRRAYFMELLAAADGDLSVTWQDAHDRLDREPIGATS